MMLVPWLIFIGASLLEVGGDAVIRKGLRGGRALVIVAGSLMLAGYGLLVNAVSWNFSKLLGVYIAFFATASILCGRFLFRENVPTSMWLGLTFIIVGGLLIQFGQR